MYCTNFHQILESEYHLYENYQLIIRDHPEGEDLSWLYELGQNRKKLLLNLIETCKFSTSFDKINSSNKLNNNVRKIYEDPELSENLTNLEWDHLKILKKFEDDFNTPPEEKALVKQKLIPLSERNIGKIRQHLLNL